MVALRISQLEHLLMSFQGRILNNICLVGRTLDFYRETKTSTYCPKKLFLLVSFMLKVNQK